MADRRALDIDMVAVARRVLAENGFRPDVPEAVARDVPRDPVDDDAIDLTHLPWSSIDNHDSRDLDQVEASERLDGGAIRLWIGIADVDAFAPKGSLVDEHAYVNTTSLYTGVRVFPMLPRELSEDRTSLLPGGPRLAMVTEVVVRKDGSLDDRETRIYQARVQNHAKLVYERVGAWLEGDRRRGLDTNPDTDDERILAQLEMQDEAAQRLRARRYELGALDFETIEARPVAKDGRIVDLQVTRKNRARQVVEDLMIAANGATARYLEQRGSSSIRRVVRAPRRWDRIVALAREHRYELPDAPDARALADFLAEQKAADAVRFADVSLAVVKLLGPGEYVLQRATDPDTGHFGLAVEDYAHSTAPNRRYPDLVTQRLLKSVSRQQPACYSDDELMAIATHCTDRENAARKVERTLRKIAAAVLLTPRIGEEFEAIVTGAAAKGTYARLLRPPAEGRIVRGERGLDVGDHIRVRLLDTDPHKGFVDFERC